LINLQQQDPPLPPEPQSTSYFLPDTPLSSSVSSSPILADAVCGYEQQQQLQRFSYNFHDTSTTTIDHCGTAMVTSEESIHAENSVKKRRQQVKSACGTHTFHIFSLLILY
jgi:hypothetical protein